MKEEISKISFFAPFMKEIAKLVLGFQKTRERKRVDESGPDPAE